MQPTLLMAGATGLVGREVVTLAVASPRVSGVTALVRRPLAQSGTALHAVVSDMTTLDTHAALPCSHALCALGTTIRKAGSQAAFRAVDFDTIVAFGRLARRSGATRFGLVSSVGASAASANFYLRVKGEAEDALGRLGFEGLYILRPGLLLGARTESRPSESAFRAVGPALNVLLPGPLRKYRSIHARDVAAGLLGSVLDGPPGTHILHYDEILAAGR
jgi:uncharacterized protein YbjT (DUF2867 family)